MGCGESLICLNDGYLKLWMSCDLKSKNYVLNFKLMLTIMLHFFVYYVSG